jgi:PAS domain S-box-containing protein
MPTDQPPDPGLSEARMAELVIDHARDYAIFTMELDGRITSWSSGAERITGYPPGEAIGMNFAEFFSASDRSTGQPKLELDKAWKEGRAEDTRWHLRKGGERFWANGVTSSFTDGEFRGLIKVMRDETRNRLADEQRVLLLNELNHRINNTLVTVQSLVEQMDPISIVREGKAWAFKHKTGFLGLVQTHEEATRLACSLAASLLSLDHVSGEAFLRVSLGVITQAIGSTSPADPKIRRAGDQGPTPGGWPLPGQISREVTPGVVGRGPPVSGSS